MRLRHLLLSTTLLLAAQTANAASYGKHDFAATSVLSEGLWVKVAADGDKNRILQISYGQLRDMGFAHPEHVQVYGYGGHVLSENLDEMPCHWRRWCTMLRRTVCSLRPTAW